MDLNLRYSIQRISYADHEESAKQIEESERAYLEKK